ncbi:hypothetical protein ALC56_06724, partial [Trachymyrmex septentrionalis]
RFETARNDGDNSRVNLVDSHYRIYRGRDGKVRKVNHDRSFYPVAPNGCTIPPSSAYMKSMLKHDTQADTSCTEHQARNRFFVDALETHDTIRNRKKNPVLAYI